jgi:LysR family glycine cleavage system transcriptional activator
MRTSIKAIQAFEAAARLGSFAPAADELAVTPSAISHQVCLLEEQLGTMLFHRVHRSVLLTDVGYQYGSEVVPAFAQIHAATRVAARARRGRAFGARYAELRHAIVDAAASSLQRGAPRGVDLRVQCSVDRIDLGQGIVDVDIRYNRQGR